MSDVDALALCREWIDREIHALRQRRTLAGWLTVYDLHDDWHAIRKEHATNGPR